MTPDRHQIEEIVAAALGRAGAERDVYLDSACGSNADLRSAVDSLLTNASWAEDFLETPIAGSISKTMLRERGSLVGKQLGVYRIESAIDGGGQGDVYKGYDTRMACAVAIKVLPPEMASRSDLRQRFEREARAVAGLSHPHICTPHYFGHQDGIDYLVMDYLDGETLAHRLKKGPLPLEQALRYAIEVAGALAYAHRHGVIHRDLKPGNIMLVKSGAKVLDFGLAKVAKEQRSKAGHETRSMTEEGVIVGTLQYMAPEQLEAKEADARTDIFAFGAVLYEMLTGKKAFEGKSQASLIAAIMSAEPASITALQPMSPSALERVVKKCLAKDPEERWQTASDLKSELQWIAEPGGSEASVFHRHKDRERLPWILLALAALGALALAVVHFRETPLTNAPPVIFLVSAPDKGTLAGDSAVSPDGRSLAFAVTSADGRQSLWLRRLDSSEARPLAGVTEGTADPFWSPDSKSIGFFDHGLKSIDVSGGSLKNLSKDLHESGGTWNGDGVIVFSGEQASLFRVSSVGGSATQVTTLDKSRGEIGHHWPQFLPDGRHFLYLAFCNAEHQANDGIYVGSLDSKETKRLVSTHWKAAYAPAVGKRDGYLLFVRGGTLMAQRFDPNRLKLSGEAVSVAEKVVADDPGASAYFSVSATGILAHASAGTVFTQLTWYDRSGKQLGTVNRPGQDGEPTLSPDGKRLAFTRPDPQAGNNLDIWVLDLVRGAATRFTFDPANDFWPVWSPDGSRIVFASDRDGSNQLFQKNSSGTGSEDVLLKSDESKWPCDWSNDGRFIYYGSFNPKSLLDGWILPMDGVRKPFPLVQAQFMEGWGMFSPDRRWVAYNSDETGRTEVYVQPFNPSAGIPGQPSSPNVPPGGKWQISTNGGYHHRWRRDGKELFYITGERKMMAVDIKSGPEFQAGIPKALFEARFSTYVFTHPGYDVSSDGQRFLINTIVGEEKQPITVVVNWEAALPSTN